MAQKNDTPALVLALLITIALIGGGVWWFFRQPSLLGNLPSSSPMSDAPSSPATSNAPSSPIPPTQSTQQFAQVQAVPTGLFNYGGSTSWAPIRGTIDPVIQQTWGQFRLRYTEPVSGTPGSANGIRMLIDNQLAFAQSSRSLKAGELQAAQQRGFTLKEIPVALEAIAVGIHPDLTIPGLTIEQLKGIYTGRITNWNQVDGPDLPITPYSRRVEDGGTVEFFQENVLQGNAFSSTVRQVETTTLALREIAATPGSIYYASAPEVVGQCGIQPIALGRHPDELVAPYQTPLIPAAQCPAQRNQVNRDVFQSGKYPLTRNLFVIAKQDGQIDQQAGEAYANLLLTDQGQELLSKQGFVRIR